MVAGLVTLGCGPVEPPTVAVTGVSLNKTALSLIEGESESLTATVAPDNATNKVVSWKSSDESVASVADGKVTAIKAGNATITVTTADGGKTATCSVTVDAKTIPATSIKLDKTTLGLVEGESETLKATVTPDNATNKEVIWESTDNAVATVVDGKVTAVKAGKAKIIATVKPLGLVEAPLATCEVTVTAKTIAVTGVTLDKPALNLVEGDSETLTATVAPDNATNKEVSWKSSDDAVATVADGKVTAVKAGSATITVTTADGGKTATCEVTVTAKTIAVTGVTLDKTELSLVEGEEAVLAATVAPDDATNKDVSWKSSDDAVATVADGKVTAVKAGSATITVTTADGGKTATCAVSVTAKVIPVESVAVNPETLTITEGDTGQLEVVITPADATVEEISWISTNQEVATVDEKGLVTAVKVGKTKVFAKVKTPSGEVEAFCEVTVNPDATLKGIAFGAEKYEVTAGASITLEVIYTPEYAANKNVTWESSSPYIASVNSDGVVRGGTLGEAVITATSEEGGYKASCVVTVTSPTTTGLYWYTDDYKLVINGTPLNEHILHPCIDPEGNVYYSSAVMAANMLMMEKNGENMGKFKTDVLNTGSSNAPSSMAAAGGGRYYIPYTSEYRKCLYVMRLYDDGGCEPEILIDKGSDTYTVDISDLAADKQGNLYIVGEYKDEYNVRNAVMWKLDYRSLQVEKTLFTNGSKNTEACAVAVEGSDVWCLVFEGEDSSADTSTLALYKNGKRQSTVTEKLSRRSSICCDLAVVGGNVYALVNEKVKTSSGEHLRVVVYKNGTLLYNLKEAEDVYAEKIAVSSNGDVYSATSGTEFTIWKNNAVIYTPTSFRTLFIKE